MIASKQFTSTHVSQPPGDDGLTPVSKATLARMSQALLAFTNDSSNLQKMKELALQRDQLVQAVSPRAKTQAATQTQTIAFKPTSRLEPPAETGNEAIQKAASRSRNLEGWLHKKSPNVFHGWQVTHLHQASLVCSNRPHVSILRNSRCSLSQRCA